MGSVSILGYIWQPGVGPCAQFLKLDKYDLENIGDFTRENVLDWLYLHCGDFQEIIDFEASELSEARCFIPWADEDNQFTYDDLMYGTDE